MNEPTTVAKTSSPRNPVRQIEAPIILALILLNAGLMLARLTSAEALGSANDRSRWCTVWSLSARGTYQIDEIIARPGWDTIDKVRHEGHFYSTKPPLYPTMLAGLYRGVRMLTGWSLLTETNQVARTILLISNLIPFWIALYVFWGILVRSDIAEEWRVLTTGLLAFASLLLPYLIVLNNHTIAATALIFSVYGAIRAQQASSNSESGKASAWWFILAGFFGGWTCCNELPAGLYGLCLFVMLWRVNPRQTLVWFVPAAVIPLSALLINNVIATGGWKPFYMYYGTEKYVYEHLGIPSYWAEPRGVDRARDSVASYIFHCLVGHHGIFSLTPIWLISLPGMLWGIQKGKTCQRGWFVLTVIVTAGVLLFYWKRVENYNYGGVSVSLRWTLWMIPLWLMALAQGLNYCRTKNYPAIALAILTVPSIYSAWECWSTPWQQPWLFSVLETRGLINYSDPPPALKKPVNSWLSLLPADAQAENYWAEYRVGTDRYLVVSDGGPTEFRQHRARSVQMKWFDSQRKLQRSLSLVVDQNQFDAGADPENFLLAWTEPDSMSIQEEPEAFLRSLPQERAYRRSHDRFLFVPFQEDAIRCMRLASQVPTTLGTGIDELKATSRTDLWLSDQIPFGLVQLQRTITSVGDSLVRESETWTLTRCGMVLSGESRLPSSGPLSPASTSDSP